MGARYAKVRLSNWGIRDRQGWRPTASCRQAVDDMCLDLSYYRNGCQRAVLRPTRNRQGQAVGVSCETPIAPGAAFSLSPGQTLLSKFRDLMDRQTTEGQFLNDLKKAGRAVHLRSSSARMQPDRVSGVVVYRIVDARYRQQKPVWMTLNIAGKEDAERLLTLQLWDRLRDGAS